MAPGGPPKGPELMGGPLSEAVAAYLERNPARFHMPGHKGRAEAVPFLGEAVRWDITEVAGADSLYEAAGPIAETEARYAALYGGAGALLSAGGSTLCIQTMLALAARPGDAVLCGRGVHTAALNAMALLDLHPVWMHPAVDPVTGLARPLSPARVEEALAAHPHAAALYLTSPDYYGQLCDLEAIAPLCKARNVPLLVDNAHGAHLKFLEPDLHPMTLGADLCCDSLHKTLPALTGGALLHIGNPRYLPDAKRRMSLFGSTSPSYLILLSMDEVLPALEAGVSDDLAALARRMEALRTLAAEGGFQLPAGRGDPIRLALGFGGLGLDREAFRAHLDAWGVEPEYLSDRFCVLLGGTCNSDEDFARLEGAVRAAPRRSVPPPRPPAPLPPPERGCSLREAMLAPSEAVPTEKAAGRICAGMVAPCPPGIPLAAPGEKMDENLCLLLRKCGILSVNVVK